MATLADDLPALLASVNRPGDFFTTGIMPIHAPGLQVEGVGAIALPLLPAQAAALIAVAERAPFGRGPDTMVDPSVRRSWQIAPGEVRIEGKHWQRTLDTILDRVADGLGVSEPIDTEFYKLLIYDEGSFFKAHRDTEKADGMFATLVIVLPSCSRGGELVVGHAGREAKLDLRTEDPGEAAFAAFYADCVHEVLPVTDGCRLALIYNLVRRKRRGVLRPPDYRNEQARIEARLRDWKPGQPEKLVYPLQHAYTPAGIAFDTLKGEDAAIAGVLAAAAPRAGCELHLALLTVEESGIADFTGDYDDEFEAGEVTDDCTSLSEWRALHGASFEFDGLPVLADEVSPPEYLEDLEPDEEHFHEATGNEGASFERSYRRAALVLWPGGRRLAVFCQAGLQATLPALERIVQRSEKSTSTEDRQEALALAAQIIDQWPIEGWYPDERTAPSNATRMLGLIAELNNEDHIDRFVTRVIAAGVYGEGDNDALLAALVRLPPKRQAALLTLVVKKNADTHFGACCRLLARALGKVPELDRTARHLLTAMPTKPEPHDPWRRSSRVRPDVVADLLTTFIAIDRALAENAVAVMLASPETYGMDVVVVPALRRLLPCGDPALVPLLAAVRLHLRTRTAEPLAPPADWRRNSKVGCTCANCRQLSDFLNSPGQRTWILRAIEQVRGHVADTIRRARPDIDSTTEKRGRPYSLVCTKNQATYERRAAQRAQDLSDLALLES